MSWLPQKILGNTVLCLLKPGKGMRAGAGLGLDGGTNKFYFLHKFKVIEERGGGNIVWEWFLNQKVTTLFSKLISRRN